MNNIFDKINIIISNIATFLSITFGELWFLFVFLMCLNIVDYITGTMKARYLKIESSREGFKGFVKTISIWVLIAISFGISYSLIKLGSYFNENLEFTIFIGWFVLTSCIVNEIRSILENLIQMDKGEYIPSWFVKGLKVTQNIMNKNADNVINNIENTNF